ncbi:MAG: amino acid-binding protein [Micrococcales bacterium 73-13]|nr:MAG: amino acid-binding protein [Micrococcales bacterium 73-13]
MKTTLSGRRAIAVAASVGAIALVLAGCARGGGDVAPTGEDTSAAVEPSPGITDTTLTFGISTPLTGATAGPGNCTVDGALAYFGTKNAEGGITFGDGKTRKIEIKSYDDEYNPEKSAANFNQMVADGVFAAGLGLGTPTNRAWREAAIEADVPQVLVMTGDPIFSDRTESPVQLGLVPIYQQEGAAFGEALVANGQPHKVAALYQNDDYGKGYLQGFKDAVAGNPNIEIVKELSYEPGPASSTPNYLEPQVTELAGTGADVFFQAVSVTPRVVENLAKAAAIGWTPIWFLPSNTASPGGVLTPAGVTETTYPGIYAVGFSEAAAAPPFAESEAGKAYFAAIAEYAQGPEQDGKAFPHCVWSWIGAQILEQAFEKMTEPTRDSFLDALYSIKGFDAQFAFGSIDTTVDGLPAIQTVSLQKFNGKGYTNVDVVG